MKNSLLWGQKCLCIENQHAYWFTAFRFDLYRLCTAVVILFC